jgi:hypothetical protein
MTPPVQREAIRYTQHTMPAGQVPPASTEE